MYLNQLQYMDRFICIHPMLLYKYVLAPGGFVDIRDSLRHYTDWTSNLCNIHTSLANWHCR